MAWAGIIAGLLGAGGSVAGGALGAQGGGRASDAVSSYYNTSLDYASQASIYDALNQIGFGNVNNIPSPYQQLIGQLEGIPLDAKTRRRAISTLNNIRSDMSLYTDPEGRNLTPEQLDILRNGGRLPGRLNDYPTRKLLNPSEFDPYYAQHGNPTQGLGRLEQALGAAGLSLQDMQKTFSQQKQFDDQIERLRAAGLGQMNEESIINRARANAAANSLLGDAGRFATGADPTEFQTGLLDRINQNINEQEQQYLLRAQFGGFNPGQGMRDFQNMRQDSDITGLTQAVQAASALLGGLQGGAQVSQQAAQQSSGSALGALGIAANQAMAANQLGQNASINRADSYANGASGAANSLSQSLLLSSLFNQRSSTPATKTYGGTGTETGFWLGSGR